jgi:hypothetical protein
MLQKIKFPWWVKLIVFLFAIVLVNIMTWLITSINQQTGLYSVNADSIGIPIIFTASASLLMLPILIVISLLSKKDSLIGLKAKGISRNLKVRIGLLFLYAPALLFGVYGIMYWSYPGHYLIAGSYLILCGVFLSGLAFDWRRAGPAIEQGQNLKPSVQ